ncbi:cytochrome P450 [Apodospora peruviana]|uniref:Cytochrome P450 n=1 Tax=Apodospora peruviana TaxID=516989 RepID=A0AAE0IB51_9PEZI|nr:cytochrome P450 [Apodospora peruviana]
MSPRNGLQLWQRQQTWGLCLIVVVGALVLHVTYNIHFHRLSKYPGPAYAAVTDMVYCYVVASGNILPWLEAQHKKYGHGVRIGPDRLSFIHHDAWKDIYSHRPGGKIKPNNKDPRFYDLNFNGHPSIVTELDDTEHARVRRVFSHAFSDKALKSQQGLLIKYVDQLVSNIQRDLAQNPDTIFDAVKLYNFTTFDIMGDLTFGESLSLLQTSSYSEWVKTVFASIRMVSMITFFKEYRWLGKIFALIEPPFSRRAGEKHLAHSVERVNHRLEKRDREDHQPDIWTLVLQQPEGDRLLTPAQMHANASIFMLAGTETTATLLSGVTFFLLKNPDKMRLLVDEIRGAFASDDQLTIEGLQKLKYLTACLEEGMRCYPPVPSPLFRVTPEEGNIICGDRVPGNIRVSVAPLATFKSPLNFKDPEEFIPERWLPGSEYYYVDHREAMQPFSVGPRNCLGQNLAYHEMRLILAKVLWNFDLSLCQESENWQIQKCYMLWEKGPLLVEMKARRQDLRAGLVLD